MLENKQLITIKGTNNGLTLFIDESCSFQMALKELKKKIRAAKPEDDEPVVSVTIKLGKRYLDEEEEAELREVIESVSHLNIQSIDSDVIHKEDVLKIKEDSQIKLFNRVIRSGQVLDESGDILLIGDVNPGGEVIATGNIYIMGSLFGTAHAGASGDRNAFIATAFMRPTQIRIAEYISRSPDYESEGVYMQCGLVDEEQDKIIIDRLQILSHKRKEISRFERRMHSE